MSCEQVYYTTGNGIFQELLNFHKVGNTTAGLGVGWNVRVDKTTGSEPVIAEDNRFGFFMGFNPDNNYFYIRTQNTKGVGDLLTSSITMHETVASLVLNIAKNLTKAPLRMPLALSNDLSGLVQAMQLGPGTGNDVVYDTATDIWTYLVSSKDYKKHIQEIIVGDYIWIYETPLCQYNVYSPPITEFDEETKKGNYY